MDFISYMNSWVKSEVTQGRIMIVIGLLLVIALIGIIRGQNELLRGMIVPISLLLIITIGYGSFILYSRPAHAQQSIERFEQSPSDGIEAEIQKHVNDNKAGKMLMKFVYPGLMILSILLLLAIPSPYYKGMALGFVFVFASTFVIDYGFVSRSDAFIAFLKTL